jgi:hypothetical protein
MILHKNPKSFWGTKNYRKQLNASAPSKKFTGTQDEAQNVRIFVTYRTSIEKVVYE